MDSTTPPRPAPVLMEAPPYLGLTTPNPTPPVEMIEKPTARKMMDGVLHNLARKQKKVWEQNQKKSPRFEEPISKNGDYFNSAAAYPDRLPSIPASSPGATVPKKGILKPPRVRFFEEELGDLSQPAPPPMSPPHYIPPINFVPPEHMYTGSHDPLAPPLPPPPPPPPPPPDEAPPAEPPAPLSLYLPAIDEDAYLSEIAYKLYTKFMDELAEFVDMQGEVIGTRLMVQEKRQQLKILRENVSRSDVVLMDYLRSCMAEGIESDDPKLVKLFNEAQQARDYVGPVEAEYEPLEVRLGADEHQLKEKYSLIEGRFENFFRLNATSTTNISVPSRIDYDANSVSASGVREWTDVEPRQSDPFFGAYIGDDKVGVGQLPVIMDQYHPSEDKSLQTSGVSPLDPKSSDTPEQTRKRRSTITPSEDQKDQKDRKPTALLGMDDTELQSHFADAETETREKRIHENLKGISDAAVSFDTSTQAFDELAREPGLDEVDTILLRTEDSDTQSTLSDYLLSFESTRDRVNRWLLHKLRISPREAFALRRQIMTSSSGVQDWANLALNLWPTDDLGLGQAYIQGSVEERQESPQVPQHVPLPYPDAEPRIESGLKVPRPRSASVSNIAYAPTISDLQNRTLSNSQSLEVLSAVALRTVSSL
ncbi:hypothetical protein P154DRAFT_564320 [Amniculicola lignicola CBS 123094]|uniref:Uncharacterized protein n=1 Tax=Amniculicola lignicola CBS 123094 TaxID=1392246 RepID=A0A6A5WDU6_9PLEO|nr:hypothetical protein P154DRAFT_564320 [Amniculicola lignicola CBS 123094]